MGTNLSAGGIDFYAQAWRIWPRAAFGLRLGPSGAPGGVRESFRSSFWALRRSFWSSREVILESPKVIFELLEVIFCSFESIQSSGFHFPRFFGVTFAVEFIFATMKMVFGHIELILSSNSFATCYSIQPARSC